MRTLLFALAAVFLAADGYVHGIWTGRWQTPHELEAASARLPSVPMTIGDWQATAHTLPPRHVELAGFTAYLSRSYQNRRDGSVVNVLLACGPAGPLSVHTPEVCYVGAGFEQEKASAQQSFTPDGSSAATEFWQAKYTKKQTLGEERCRVLWSWHGQEGWQAPNNPRWSFAGLPVIHKLYVTCPLKDTREEHDDAVCANFMKAFLPALDKALFRAP